jgi:Tfp pilus assembly protein PilF
MRTVRAGVSRWAIILMAQTCLAAAPARPTAPTTARVDVEAQVEEGRAALADRRYEPARKSFKDALAVEPKNVVALHGIGLACLNLKDAASACSYLDRALQQAPADRTITWNNAAAWLQNKNPMRAA